MRRVVIKLRSSCGERFCRVCIDETSATLCCQLRNAMRPAQLHVSNRAEANPDSAMTVPPCHVPIDTSSTAAASWGGGVCVRVREGVTGGVRLGVREPEGAKAAVDAATVFGVDEAEGKDVRRDVAVTVGVRVTVGVTLGVNVTVGFAVTV